MTLNTGSADRIVRFLLGAGAIVIAILMLDALSANVLGIVVGAIGLVLVLTSFCGYCPAYTLVGINTCKVKPPKD